MTLTDGEGVRVLELHVENFMGIRVADVKPEPDGLVVVGGENGQGKTSLLNAIECALRGKAWHPGEPVRALQRCSDVKVDLGAITVHRRFNDDGTMTLKVRNMDGSTPSSPQATLDGLAGAISFDPLAFSRLKPAEQVDDVLRVIGVDTRAMDAAIKTTFDERTTQNRETARLKVALDLLPSHDDAPDERVEVAELMTKAQNARDQNAAFQKARDAAHLKKDEAELAERLAQEAAADCVELQRKLELARVILKDANAQHDRAQSAQAAEERVTSQLVDFDLGPLEQAVLECEGRNRKVLENQAKQAAANELKLAETLSGQLTDSLEAKRQARTEAMASARMPIEGLQLSEDGLRFGGAPFAQASSAERLRTSIAMGMALSPQLRVMLVRDGGILDRDGMALLESVALERGYQVWIERVGDSDPGALVLRDGFVVGSPEEAERLAGQGECPNCGNAHTPYSYCGDEVDERDEEGDW